MPDDDDDDKEEESLENSLGGMELDDLQILNQLREKKATAADSTVLMPVSFIGIDDLDSGKKVSKTIDEATGASNGNGTNGAATVARGTADSTSETSASTSGTADSTSGTADSTSETGASTSETTDSSGITGSISGLTSSDNGSGTSASTTDAGKEVRVRKKGIHAAPTPPPKRSDEDAYDGGKVDGKRAFWTY